MPRQRPGLKWFEYGMRLGELVENGEITAHIVASDAIVSHGSEP